MLRTEDLNTKQERVDEQKADSRFPKGRAIKVPYKPKRTKGREYRA